MPPEGYSDKDSQIDEERPPVMKGLYRLRGQLETLRSNIDTLDDKTSRARLDSPRPTDPSPGDKNEPPMCAYEAAIEDIYTEVKDLTKKTAHIIDTLRI